MSKAPTRDLFPGSLEMMILQTLRREPMHGYALAQTIRLASNDLIQVEEGTLYPALLRMLKAGWLSSEWGVSTRNRRVRVYRITAAGRKQLAREVSAFERMMEGFRRVMEMARS
ncbi:MAG TPA: PadR family transcriptional regulator [Bryobacteraceae bacterium]|nr:PadR family transcriptional regulator [Bryobacteraceae bacterium]